MKSRHIWVHASFVALALCIGCRTSQPMGSGSAFPRPSRSEVIGQPLRVTIIGTNDVHGHVFPQRDTLRDGTLVEEGGSAIFAGYVANIRADNPGGVILLDGGDLFQGTLASNLSEGAVVVDAYNYLGYTAVAVGNHEFDYGPVGPVSMASEPGMDPFGALKARIQQAKFPFLGANIYDAATGEHPSWFGNDGTLMVEVKGLKIGIVGLTTPQTPRTTNPVNVSTLRFGSLAPEGLSAAKSLRRRGADVVIATVHAGGKCTAFDNPRDLSSCENDGEVFEMLQELPPGTLDAVVAGHTHQVIGHFINGTPVIEAWGMGAAFGTIDLFVDPKKKSVIPDKTEVKAGIPICARADAHGGCDPKKIRESEAAHLVQATFAGKAVVPDQKLAQLLEPALQRVLAEQNRKLGVKVPHELERKYEAESPLGDLLADSLREMEHADVALLNPGGIRTNLPAGDLTYGEVYGIMPFENAIATITVTGEELTRLLHAAYNAKKGVYQQSGLQVTLSRCPGAGRLKGVALADGKAIPAEKRFKVSMTDFLALGGDGLGPVLSSLPPGRIDLGASRELGIRDALVTYWQKQKRDLVAPKLGRVKYVDDGAQCPSPGS